MMRKPRVALLGADLRRGLQAGHHHIEGRGQEHGHEYSQRRIAAPQRPAALSGQAGAAPRRTAAVRRRLQLGRSCRHLPGAPRHAAQDEVGETGQDRQHEQADRGAQRDVAGLNADREGVGGENMGDVLRPARGQDAHDVEIGEGDDQAEQHGDRMMLRIIGSVTKSSFCIALAPSIVAAS